MAARASWKQGPSISGAVGASGVLIAPRPHATTQSTWESRERMWWAISHTGAAVASRHCSSSPKVTAKRAARARAKRRFSSVRAARTSVWSWARRGGARGGRVGDEGDVGAGGHFPSHFYDMTNYVIN